MVIDMMMRFIFGAPTHTTNTITKAIDERRTYLETGKVDAGIELGAFFKYLAHGILVAHVDLMQDQSFLELLGLVLEAGYLRHAVERNSAGIGQVVHNDNGVLDRGGQQADDGVGSDVSAPTGDEDAWRR